MKKLLFLIVFTFHFAISQAQEKLQNKLTTNHQIVEGSKISLIPPTGFTKAANFQGFLQNESGSSIMVMELPGPFSESSKGLTKENFKPQGVEVKKIEQLSLNGLPAILVTAEQVAHGNTYSKYIFAFGTETESIIINGSYPKDQKELSSKIKSSLLSTYYDANKVINPLDNVDYTIATSGTKLKFAKSVANSLVYTTDGIIPAKSEDKSTFIVGKSFSESEIGDKELFAINRFLKLPIEFTNTEKLTENIKKITINGLSGFEISFIGKNKNTGKLEQAYQAILFDGSLYYILLGLSDDKFEENNELFRSISKTFKKK